MHRGAAGGTAASWIAPPLEPMRIALTRPVPESLAHCELTHRRASRSTSPSRRRSISSTKRRCGRSAAPCATCRRHTICRTRCSSKTWRSCSTRSPSSPGPAPRRAGPSARPWRRSCPSTGRSSRSPPRARSTAATCCGLDGRSTSDSRRARTRTARGSSPARVAVTAMRSNACRQRRACTSSRRSRSSIPTACCAIRRGSTRVCSRQVDVIPVDPSEPFAANVLLLGHTIVCAASHERTAADLTGARLQRLHGGCLGAGEGRGRGDVLQSDRRRQSINGVSRNASRTPHDGHDATMDTMRRRATKSS